MERSAVGNLMVSMPDTKAIDEAENARKRALKAATQARYRLRHPEKSRAATKRYTASHRELVRQRQKANYESDTTRDRYLVKKYGITLEQYHAIEAQQLGKCACCLGAPTRDGRLFVDHNHQTGQVRGLLCHQCNVALGLAREKTEILEQMISYLKRGR